MGKIINLNDFKINKDVDFETKKIEVDDFVNRMSIDEDLNDFFDEFIEV